MTQKEMSEIDNISTELNSIFLAIEQFEPDSGEIPHTVYSLAESGQKMVEKLKKLISV